MNTVVLIENNHSLREKYIEMINSSKGFRVIADFENFEPALKQIKELNPSIILLDINVPEINGIDGIKYIKRIIPDIKIIVVTTNSNHQDVFEALYAGAIGYLTKFDESNIIDALKQVEQGGAPMSNTISRMVVESFQEYQFKELTRRENEVFILLAAGKSYADIAKKLYVSHNTVKYHLRNIYEKLDIYCRDEAINLLKRKKNYLKVI